MNEINKIFDVIHVIRNDWVEVVSYLVKDVGHISYTQSKVKRGTYVTPVTWYYLSKTFLDRFSQER